MGPKRKVADKKITSPKAASNKASSSVSNANVATTTTPTATSGSSAVLPPSAGYLISCDIPTKQFIVNLNDEKTIDKKFIIEDLDAEHLLVKMTARTEIEREVEKWMDENVFSAIERVGENLDMS